MRKAVDPSNRFAGGILPLAMSFFALVLLLHPTDGAADPTNYQRYIIGERAIGMGGAQTAAVNDPMANLYNPAAMVFTASTMVSASKCLYSLDYRKIEGGYVPRSSFDTSGETPSIDAVNLQHKNDLTLPSTLALTTRFGKKIYRKGPRRHAFGIAILVPNQDEFTFSPKVIDTGTEELRDRETYRLSESYKQVWMGVSYALRANKKLGLGVSAFLATTSYSRHMTFSRYGDSAECSLTSCGFMEFKESDLSIDTVSLLFRVGGLWEPHRNWRFGLVVSAPSILLGDLKLYKTAGSLKQTYGAAWVTGNADDYASYFSDKYKLAVRTREPMSIRGGGAFLWNDSFTFDVDMSVFLPISYDRIIGNPVIDRACPAGQAYCDVIRNENASPEWYDRGIYRSIDREAVVNVNLGWEAIINDKWTIRNGFYTDFSAAPRVEPSIVPQQMRVNHYGMGISGGFKAQGYDISVGITGSLGYGNASVYNPHSDHWEPAALEERALYVFIAGIQSAAVKTSKKVVKKVKDQTKEKKRKKKLVKKAMKKAEEAVEEVKAKAMEARSGEEGSVEHGDATADGTAEGEAIDGVGPGADGESTTPEEEGVFGPEVTG